MSKHTPGPWAVNGNKIDGNGYHIISINSHKTTEGQANALLIASLPDLLESLLEVKGMMHAMDMMNTPVGIQVAKSIAKATGEQA